MSNDELRRQAGESESDFHARAARFQEEAAERARDHGDEESADHMDDRARRARARRDQARREGK